MGKLNIQVEIIKLAELDIVMRQIGDNNFIDLQVYGLQKGGTFIALH